MSRESKGVIVGIIYNGFEQLDYMSMTLKVHGISRYVHQSPLAHMLHYQSSSPPSKLSKFSNSGIVVARMCARLAAFLVLA